MNKLDFLKLMEFPEAWRDMYPDELYNIQLGCYKPGDERSPEHFRYGAFLWWLKNRLSHDDIVKIKNLAEQEEEFGIRDEILGMIRNAEAYRLGRSEA